MAQESSPSQGKKTEKTIKRSSALKRDLQNKKRRLKNRSFLSSVHTAVRSLEASLSKKQEAPDVLKQKLNGIYSLIDKGVKRGIVKKNTAARTKSRLTVRYAKA